MMAPDALDPRTRAYVADQRDDIDTIHWDQAVAVKHPTRNVMIGWDVPVQSHFAIEDTGCRFEVGEYRGTLRVEWVGDAVDYWVGDWEKIADAECGGCQKTRGGR